MQEQTLIWTKICTIIKSFIYYLIEFSLPPIQLLPLPYLCITLHIKSLNVYKVIPLFCTIKKKFAGRG
jgi:hypothetical protein